MAKAKSKTTPAEKPGSLREAGLETFVVEEMHRSKLVAAAYNPRRITDQERDKLKAALSRHGLVAPVVWNSRTGNLVGGHQRILIMDSLMGTKDYTLQVCKIDVDEAKEREINILLNNSQAGGSFDLDALKHIFEDPAVTIEGAGFSQNDMVSLFGTGVFDTRQQDLEDFAKNLAETSDRYTAVQEKNKKKGGSEHYLVHVFPSGAHVEAFIRAQQLDDNRYQNGKKLMEKLGVPMPVEK